MKKLFENWRGFITEQEEEGNVLDLSKELDSGFCDFNPLINQYAQNNADNLAEMLIFVIATQQMRWYDVVPKFPTMMAYIKKEDIGVRLDKILRKNFSSLSFIKIQKLIRIGFFKVNNRKVKSNYKIDVDENIQYSNKAINENKLKKKTSSILIKYKKEIRVRV